MERALLSKIALLQASAKMGMKNYPETRAILRSCAVSTRARRDRIVAWQGYQSTCQK